MSKTIMLINGPNLNLLGTREPETYGYETLQDIEQQCADHASTFGVQLISKQSNSEGELINYIHEAKTSAQAIVINPGAYTHTSIAIRDALSAVNLPVFEIHISNVHAREEFRHHSYISGIAVGVICGFGTVGYKYAIERACHHISESQ